MVVTAESVFPQIVGCGRSGTTLLRNMLDAHSKLAMTHEAHFVGPMARQRARYESPKGLNVGAFVDDLYRDPNFRRQGVERSDLETALTTLEPEDYADAVRVVFATYASGSGKHLYGDKTPGSVSHIDEIASLFPEARFIHIVRDGRDVALSYLERPEWGPQTVAEAANHWKSRVRRGRDSGTRLGNDRYIEVRYEDLVADPAAQVRRICDFLRLDYEPSMLEYHQGSREFIQSTQSPDAFKNLAKPVTAGMRDWEDTMSDSDREIFEAIAGRELEEFGYPVLSRSPSLSTRVRVAAAALSWQVKRLLSTKPMKRVFMRNTSTQNE